MLSLIHKKSYVLSLLFLIFYEVLIVEAPAWIIIDLSTKLNRWEKINWYTFFQGCF